MSLKLVPPRQGRSANWRLRGTVRGQYIDETTGTSERDVAEAIRIQRESQLLSESVFGPRATRTFADAALTYVETVRPTGPQRTAIIGFLRKDGSVSPGLINDLGDKLCSEISPAHIDAIVKSRFPNAKPNTIVRHVITPLTAVLRFAARRGWCDVPLFDRPKYDDRRRRWATYEEADRLLASATLRFRSLLLFLLLTGARTGEALGLKWADVRLDERWLVFHNTKRNNEDRGVPIHRQVATLLAELPHRQGHVFLTDRGQAYVPRTATRGGGYIKTAWRSTCRRAGISDLRAHDLRHTCATWLTMAGVHEQVRDEILGHASTSMGRRYAHVPREQLLDAIDKLPERRLVELAFEHQGQARKGRPPFAETDGLHAQPKRSGVKSVESSMAKRASGD